MTQVALVTVMFMFVTILVMFAIIKLVILRRYVSGEENYM